MALKTKRIPVSNLQVGMYVCELDCSWTDTPYPLQGFYVASQKDIDKVSHYTQNVVIDLEWVRNAQLMQQANGTNRAPVAAPVEEESHWARADAADQTVAKKAPEKPNNPFLPQAKKQPPSVVASTASKQQAMSVGEESLDINPVKPKVSVTPLKVNHERYKDTTTLSKELPVAVELYGELTKEVAKVSAALRMGNRIETRKITQLARGMAQSVVRNADAFVWLARVKAHDQHSYDHSLACSIWAVVFGRRIGLAAQDLENLTIAALLSKIGIIKVPKSVLTKPGKLTDTERKIFQKFVEYGAAEIKMLPGIDPEVSKIVEYHRERHNGSGFPKAVKGNQIPDSAKMLGLVDYFEELISPRLAKPMSTADAISKLYETRDHLFQEDLVEEFIRAVGVYPAGTLVEMTNAEVGVIVKHNPSRRLRPQVMMLLDSEHRPLKKVRMVDLMKTLEDKKGRPLHIEKALPHGTYGIKPDQYMDAVAKANVGGAGWKIWAR